MIPEEFEDALHRNMHFIPWLPFRHRSFGPACHQTLRTLVFGLQRLRSPTSSERNFAVCSKPQHEIDEASATVTLTDTTATATTTVTNNTIFNASLLETSDDIQSPSAEVSRDLPPWCPACGARTSPSCMHASRTRATSFPPVCAVPELDPALIEFMFEELRRSDYKLFGW